MVAVKRVVDPYVKIRVKADGTGVETQNVKMSLNPFDEIAVEEAIRLREQNIASEVIVVTVGGDVCQESLRQALALGADRALLVRTETCYCSLDIAKILQQLVKRVEPSLVLMGKQAIDGDNNQTPQMLAGLLDWPQATYASKIVVSGELIHVTREIDSGLETLELPLPAVVSTDLRLNEPRYASLPNIMKAKSKPLEVVSVDALGLSFKKHIEVLSVKAPEAKARGVQVHTVEELLDRLRHDAKVLG